MFLNLTELQFLHWKTGKTISRGDGKSHQAQIPSTAPGAKSPMPEYDVPACLLPGVSRVCPCWGGLRRGSRDLLWMIYYLALDVAYKSARAWQEVMSGRLVCCGVFCEVSTPRAELRKSRGAALRRLVKPDIHHLMSITSSHRERNHCEGVRNGKEKSRAFGGFHRMNAKHFLVYRPFGLRGWRQKGLEIVWL